MHQNGRLRALDQPSPSNFFTVACCLLFPFGTAFNEKPTMRFTLLLIANLFIMINTGAQFTNKRQVLIFGDPKSEPVAQQLQLLKKEAPELEERDMTITLAGKNVQLYRKYKVAPSDSFTLILIGKDGGEKYRSQQQTPAQELFALIDAMPMRQSEMRRGKRPRQ